jgi:hypothetical protein
MSGITVPATCGKSAAITLISATTAIAIPAAINSKIVRLFLTVLDIVVTSLSLIGYFLPELQVLA